MIHNFQEVAAAKAAANALFKEEGPAKSVAKRAATAAGEAAAAKGTAEARAGEVQDPAYAKFAMAARSVCDAQRHAVAQAQEAAAKLAQAQLKLAEAQAKMVEANARLAQAQQARVDIDNHLVGTRDGARALDDRSYSFVEARTSLDTQHQKTRTALTAAQVAAAKAKEAGEAAVEAGRAAKMANANAAKVTQRALALSTTAPPAGDGGVVGAAAAANLANARAPAAPAPPDAVALNTCETRGALAATNGRAAYDSIGGVPAGAPGRLDRAKDAKDTLLLPPMNPIAGDLIASAADLEGKSNTIRNEANGGLAEAQQAINDAIAAIGGADTLEQGVRGLPATFADPATNPCAQADNALAALAPYRRAGNADSVAQAIDAAKAAAEKAVAACALNGEMVNKIAAADKAVADARDALTYASDAFGRGERSPEQVAAKQRIADEYERLRLAAEAAIASKAAADREKAAAEDLLSRVEKAPGRKIKLAPVGGEKCGKTIRISEARQGRRQATDMVPVMESRETLAKSKRDAAKRLLDGFDATLPALRAAELQGLEKARDAAIAARAAMEPSRLQADKACTDAREDARLAGVAKTAAVAKRVEQLKAEGHGPQRHLEPGDQALSDRALYKIDPETGLQTEQKASGVAMHACGTTASKIVAPDDYVAAESKMRKQVMDRICPNGVPAALPLGGEYDTDAHIPHETLFPGRVGTALKGKTDARTAPPEVWAATTPGGEAVPIRQVPLTDPNLPSPPNPIGTPKFVSSAQPKPVPTPVPPPPGERDIGAMQAAMGRDTVDSDFTGGSMTAFYNLVDPAIPCAGVTLITMYPETRNPYPLKALPSGPGGGPANQALAVPLKSLGGAQPVVWTIKTPAPGALAAGIAINGDNLQIDANALPAGAHTFTVTVTAGAAVPPALVPESADINVTVNLA